MSEDTFVLDANIFIEAHRRYYGLDLCPGFWESLRHFAERGRILSIALHELMRESFDDDVFRGRLCPGLVLARNPADDAGDSPGGSGDGVHSGSNRTNPTFPDLGR